MVCLRERTADSVKVSSRDIERLMKMSFWEKILSAGEIENQIKNMILSIYGLQHRGGAGGENDEEQDKKQTIRREDQRACPDPFRAGL